MKGHLLQSVVIWTEKYVLLVLASRYISCYSKMRLKHSCEVIASPILVLEKDPFSLVNFVYQGFVIVVPFTKL